MPHPEHKHPNPYENHPARRFGLTPVEMRDYRVSAERFADFFSDEGVSIENLHLDSNSFGEFMFVTLAKPEQELRLVFYGLGFHEHRERWIHADWYWYAPNSLPKDKSQPDIDKDEAQQVLQDRLAFVQASNNSDEQSSYGKWFEIIADLSDEDGAYSEMQDLPGWLFDKDP